MVMVIVRLLLENRRLRGRQAIKANSKRLKTIPLRVLLSRHANDHEAGSGLDDDEYLL
jgi:hypothetical protein